METAITIITPADLQSAGSVLAQNKSYVVKYEAKYKALVCKAEKEGIMLTPETDTEIMAFLVSAKTAHKKMNDDRSVFTKKANEFIGLFTEQENKLIKDLYPTLQAKRDASLTAYEKLDKEARVKEQLELDKAKERINLLADAEQQIRNAYADILAEDKGLLLTAFTDSTADNIDEVEDIFKNAEGNFANEVFNNINPILSSSIIKDELDSIIAKAKEGKLEKIKAHYSAEIKNYASHLLSLIPDRRKEIAEGLASESANKLKQEEAEKLAEQQVLKDKADEDLRQKQLQEAIIDTQITQITRKSSVPNVSKIESYSITVLQRDGWAEIFKFYLTNSEEEDLGKVKLDQMKAFAERLAKSKGTFINSDSLEYEEVYKATARQTPSNKVKEAA